MTNKWQCSKCKKTRVVLIRVKTKTIKTTIEGKRTKGKVQTINPKDVSKIKCCCRVMRNLSEDIYKKEKTINESGIREKS